MRAIAFLLVLLLVPGASAMVFRPSDVPTPSEQSIPASAPEAAEAADDATPDAPPPGTEADPGANGRGEGQPPATPEPEAAPSTGDPPSPPTPPQAEAPAPPPAEPPASDPAVANTRSQSAPEPLHAACGMECSQDASSLMMFVRAQKHDPVAALERQLHDGVKELSATPMSERRLPEPPRSGALPYMPGESRLIAMPVPALDPEPPLASITEPEGIETIASTRTRPIEPAAPSPHALPRIVAASALGALLAALLYSRIARRDEALRSDRRVRIIEILTARGPMALPDLTREMGCDRTTVTHHLRLLSRLSHVVVERVDGRVVAALPGQPVSEALAPRAPDIIERLLRENGGTMTRAELHAAAADLPLRTRNHALARLASDGRIMRVLRAGTEIVLLTTPQGSAGVTAA